MGYDGNSTKSKIWRWQRSETEPDKSGISGSYEKSGGGERPRALTQYGLLAHTNSDHHMNLIFVKSLKTFLVPLYEIPGLDSIWIDCLSNSDHHMTMICQIFKSQPKNYFGRLNDYLVNWHQVGGLVDTLMVASMQICWVFVLNAAA